MKLIIYVFIFLLINITVFSQINLVNNGNFFEYNECPYQAGQFDLVKDWFHYNNTPEYFHKCSNTSVNVPNTLIGFQYGKNEDAFAGIVLWYPWYEMREYIQTRLSQSLEKNRKYCITFYVNLANGSAVGIDRIGAVLSKDTIKADTIDGLIDIMPQISNNTGNIISDTVNWIKISGVYVAQGGELILTIGNFYNDANTNVDTVNPIPGGYAYYFIDDVSVYECGEEIPNELTAPNAFTPNNDGINDIFRVQGENIETLNGTIINRWGQVLYKWADVNGGWNGTYKGQDVAEGTYFYIIIVTFANGETENFTGSVLLTR